MNDNWIEEKAREVVDAYKGEMLFKGNRVPLNADTDFLKANIAAALREAENRGLEKAKVACWEECPSDPTCPEELAAHRVCAEAIEALKTGEGR